MRPMAMSAFCDALSGNNYPHSSVIGAEKGASSDMKQVVPIILILALIGCSRQPVDVVPAGESFMPLAVGNRWIYEKQVPDNLGRVEARTVDTVRVTAKAVIHGVEFFKLESDWPGFDQGGLWLYRESNGNVFVSKKPQFGGSQFLIFDAEVGQRWPLGETLHGCLSSLALLDDYAVVNAPAGRFDGAREIGGGWIDCTDFGWTADFARGVGPVRWEAITIAGPTNWLLVEARIHDDFSGSSANNKVSGD